MQNSSKKQRSLTFNLKSARGAYQAEFGIFSISSYPTHASLLPKHWVSLNIQMNMGNFSSCLYPLFVINIIMIIYRINPDECNPLHMSSVHDSLMYKLHTEPISLVPSLHIPSPSCSPFSACLPLFAPDILPHFQGSHLFVMSNSKLLPVFVHAISKS